LGLIAILITITIYLLLDLSLFQTILFGWGLTIIYSIFVIILITNLATSYRRIKVKEVIKEVEKPVYIETPVIKEVYVEKPRKKLNIPKYNYVASTETKTYHTRNCRLGKLIKKKFKVSNNQVSFFKKRNYKSCKVCIKPKK
jgi:hypothetical protein